MWLILLVLTAISSGEALYIQEESISTGAENEKADSVFLPLKTEQVDTEELRILKESATMTNTTSSDLKLINVSEDYDLGNELTTTSKIESVIILTTTPEPAIEHNNYEKILADAKNIEIHEIVPVDYQKEFSISKLEDDIRTEVKEETLLEENFNSPIVKALEDIPDTEIRKELTTDILAPNHIDEIKEENENNLNQDDPVKEVEITTNEETNESDNTHLELSRSDLILNSQTLEDKSDNLKEDKIDLSIEENLSRAQNERSLLSFFGSIANTLSGSNDKVILDEEIKVEKVTHKPLIELPVTVKVDEPVYTHNDNEKIITEKYKEYVEEDVKTTTGIPLMDRIDIVKRIVDYFQQPAKEEIFTTHKPKENIDYHIKEELEIKDSKQPAKEEISSTHKPKENSEYHIKEELEFKDYLTEATTHYPDITTVHLFSSDELDDKSKRSLGFLFSRFTASSITTTEILPAKSTEKILEVYAKDYETTSEKEILHQSNERDIQYETTAEPEHHHNNEYKTTHGPYDYESNKHQEITTGNYEKINYHDTESNSEKYNYFENDEYSANPTTLYYEWDKHQDITTDSKEIVLNTHKSHEYEISSETEIVTEKHYTDIPDATSHGHDIFEKDYESIIKSESQSNVHHGYELQTTPKAELITKEPHSVHNNEYKTTISENRDIYYESHESLYTNTEKQTSPPSTYESYTQHEENKEKEFYPEEHFEIPSIYTTVKNYELHDKDNKDTTTFTEKIIHNVPVSHGDPESITEHYPDIIHEYDKTTHTTTDKYVYESNKEHDKVTTEVHPIFPEEDEYDKHKEFFVTPGLESHTDNYETYHETTYKVPESTSKTVATYIYESHKEPETVTNYKYEDKTDSWIESSEISAYNKGHGEVTDQHIYTTSKINTHDEHNYETTFKPPYETVKPIHELQYHYDTITDHMSYVTVYKTEHNPSKSPTSENHQLPYESHQVPVFNGSEKKSETTPINLNFNDHDKPHGHHNKVEPEKEIIHHYYTTESDIYNHEVYKTEDTTDPIAHVNDYYHKILEENEDKTNKPTYSETYQEPKLKQIESDEFYGESRQFDLDDVEIGRSLVTSYPYESITKTAKTPSYDSYDIYEIGTVKEQYHEEKHVSYEDNNPTTTTYNHEKYEADDDYDMTPHKYTVSETYQKQTYAPHKEKDIETPTTKSYKHDLDNLYDTSIHNGPDSDLSTSNYAGESYNEIHFEESPKKDHTSDHKYTTQISIESYDHKSILEKVESSNDHEEDAQKLDDEKKSIFDYFFTNSSTETAILIPTTILHNDHDSYESVTIHYDSTNKHEEKYVTNTIYTELPVEDHEHIKVHDISAYTTVGTDHHFDKLSTTEYYSHNHEIAPKITTHISNSRHEQIPEDIYLPDKSYTSESDIIHETEATIKDDVVHKHHDFHSDSLNTAVLTHSYTSIPKVEYANHKTTTEPIHDHHETTHNSYNHKQSQEHDDHKSHKTQNHDEIIKHQVAHNDKTTTERIKYDAHEKSQKHHETTPMSDSYAIHSSIIYDTEHHVEDLNHRKDFHTTFTFENDESKKHTTTHNYELNDHKSSLEHDKNHGTTPNVQHYTSKPSIIYDTDHHNQYLDNQKTPVEDFQISHTEGYDQSDKRHETTPFVSQHHKKETTTVYETHNYKITTAPPMNHNKLDIDHKHPNIHVQSIKSKSDSHKDTEPSHLYTTTYRNSYDEHNSDKKDEIHSASSTLHHDKSDNNYNIFTESTNIPYNNHDHKITTPKLVHDGYYDQHETTSYPTDKHDHKDFSSNPISKHDKTEKDYEKSKLSKTTTITPAYDYDHETNKDHKTSYPTDNHDHNDFLYSSSEEHGKTENYEKSEISKSTTAPSTYDHDHESYKDPKTPYLTDEHDHKDILISDHDKKEIDYEKSKTSKTTPSTATYDLDHESYKDHKKPYPTETHDHKESSYTLSEEHDKTENYEKPKISKTTTITPTYDYDHESNKDHKTSYPTDNNDHNDSYYSSFEEHDKTENYEKSEISKSTTVPSTYNHDHESYKDPKTPYLTDEHDHKDILISDHDKKVVDYENSKTSKTTPITATYDLDHESYKDHKKPYPTETHDHKESSYTLSEEHDKTENYEKPKISKTTTITPTYDYDHESTKDHKTSYPTDNHDHNDSLYSSSEEHDKTENYEKSEISKSTTAPSTHNHDHESYKDPKTPYLTDEHDHKDILISDHDKKEVDYEKSKTSKTTPSTATYDLDHESYKDHKKPYPTETHDHKESSYTLSEEHDKTENYETTKISKTTTTPSTYNHDYESYKDHKSDHDYTTRLEDSRAEKISTPKNILALLNNHAKTAIAEFRKNGTPKQRIFKNKINIGSKQEDELISAVGKIIEPTIKEFGLDDTEEITKAISIQLIRHATRDMGVKFTEKPYYPTIEFVYVDPSSPDKKYQIIKLKDILNGKKDHDSDEDDKGNYGDEDHDDEDDDESLEKENKKKSPKKVFKVFFHSNQEERDAFVHSLEEKSSNPYGRSFGDEPELHPIPLPDISLGDNEKLYGVIIENNLHTVTKKAGVDAVADMFETTKNLLEETTEYLYQSSEYFNEKQEITETPLEDIQSRTIEFEKDFGSTGYVIDTIVEAAELTTELSRQVNSFREPFSENNSLLTSSSKITASKSPREVVESSMDDDHGVLGILLLSLGILFTILGAISFYIIKLKKQQGTLEFEPVEQTEMEEKSRISSS